MMTPLERARLIAEQAYHLAAADEIAEKLEIEKFPQAEFNLTKLVLENLSKKEFSTKDVPFEGELNFHGVKKPVSGTVEARRNADKLALNFQFKVKMDDYGIAPPSFLGIKVHDEVEISVEAAPVLSD